MKSVFNTDKEIDLDPDGTTINLLNAEIERITREADNACMDWHFKCEELEEKIDKLTTTLVSYEATIGLLRDALEDIANEDFRGNRSSGSVKAFNALKQMGWRK